MGKLYLVLSPAIGLGFTVLLDVAGRAGTVAQSGATVDVAALTGSVLVSLGALAGLMMALPVFFLFIYDKNAGVLEYLLAVGMSQREVFKGYLKAALALSLLVMVPVVLLNLALSPSGLLFAAESGGISLVMGVSDVAFVTVLMTAFSSMQRQPTGVNSPLGVGVGIIPLFPGLVLGALLGGMILWLDLAVAMGLLVLTVALLSAVDRLIRREKLLP